MTQKEDSATKYRDRRIFQDLFEGKVSQTQKEPEFEFSHLDNSTYDLSYVCLLIPRFSNHVLKGDIVLYLESWMQNICISYGWRLDYLNIQPDYMHWVLRVQMTDTPARLIKIIRSSLSSQIFEEFPRFKKENRSKDFWAPPSMILAGKRPHPEHMIKEFIKITRKDQGYLPWRRRG